MPAILRSHVNYQVPKAAMKPALVLVEKPSRRGLVMRPWSDDEVASLRKLCANGHSYAKIGEILGRAEGSVYKKATSLGIDKVKAYFGARKAP